MRNGLRTRYLGIAEPISHFSFRARPVISHYSFFDLKVKATKVESSFLIWIYSVLNKSFIPPMLPSRLVAS